MMMTMMVLGRLDNVLWVQILSACLITTAMVYDDDEDMDDDADGVPDYNETVQSIIAQEHLSTLPT